MKCNKIFLSVFFVVILTLCLCILPDRADAATTSDLYFQLNADGKSYAATAYNGWIQENGKWYFYNKGTKVPAGWFAYGPYWYYMDQNQAMQTGWLLYGGKWYFFDHTSGRMVTEKWVQDAGKWYYFDANGHMVTGTYTIDGKQHKFNGSGVWQGEVTANGWKQENGKWYYYQNGAKATGWKTISGQWYYFEENGAMVTGWRTVGSKKYYFRESGAMAVGWVCDDGDYYYFDVNGTIKTGWLQDGGKWYYMDSNGCMVTGNQTIDGSKYRFNKDGSMYTGWYAITTLVEEPWAEAYISKLKQMESNGTVSLGETKNIFLTYIDNDDVPEVWVYDGVATYYMLCYYNGTVYVNGENQFYEHYDLIYTEKSGYFCLAYTGGNVFGDCFWKLSNGRVTRESTGDIQYINGRYIYYWNGQQVTKDEYATKYYRYFPGEVKRMSYDAWITFTAMKRDFGILKYSQKKVWYYYKPTGEMATGTTLTIGGKQYSFDDSGICLNP